MIPISRHPDSRSSIIITHFFFTGIYIFNYRLEGGTFSCYWGHQTRNDRMDSLQNRGMVHSRKLLSLNSSFSWGFPPLLGDGCLHVCYHVLPAERGPLLCLALWPHFYLNNDFYQTQCWTLSESGEHGHCPTQTLSSSDYHLESQESGAFVNVSSSWGRSSSRVHGWLAVAGREKLWFSDLWVAHDSSSSASLLLQSRLELESFLSLVW